MRDFFPEWRRRLAVHAALLLGFSVCVGFVYFGTLSHEDWPAAKAGPIRLSGIEAWCQPWNRPDPPTAAARTEGLAPPTALLDDPCRVDTPAEARWSSAHQQGLLHALLLLGIAAVAPHLRVGRFAFSFLGWLLIVGCWLAPVSAALEAFTLYSPDAAWSWVPYVLGVMAGATTTFALGSFALRSLWEVVREGIAPPTWRNWALIVKARPRRIEEPANVGDVQDAVQRALDGRLAVRAFGGRYSWNAVATSPDVMIDMRRLRGDVTLADLDADDRLLQPETVRLATAGAGTTIRELSVALAREGLALATTTVNPWIQLGGALALGCHGTGIHHAALTDLVVALELVQYEGAGSERKAVLRRFRRPLRPLDPRDPASVAAWQRWNALAVSLGCLGVVVSVTFECVPLRGMHIRDEHAPMATTIASDAALHDIVVKNEFSEIFWFPFNAECFVRTWNPVAQYASRYSRGFFVRQWAVANLAGPVVFFVDAILPFLTPLLSRAIHRFEGRIDERVPAYDAMQYARFFPRVIDAGQAIPLAPQEAGGFDAFRAAWNEVVDRIAAARHAGEFPQNLALHARFGRNCGAHLAPNSGPSPCSAFIELITHANTDGYEAHFAAVERAWRRLGGKAHWGKVSFDPGGLRDAYAPAAIVAFLDERKRIDPDEVFVNDLVRTWLHL